MSTATVTIVVPVVQGGEDLAATLQSLEEQEYPGLEVIVEMAAAGEQALGIVQEAARRQPATFRVFAEGDADLAGLLNRAFTRATGHIFGYLKAGERLFPGALHRVAAEVAPERQRFVVMGRSVFVVEEMPGIGIERPGEHAGHFEHLAVWKPAFNPVPQSALFWHRTVWNHCGRFSGGPEYVVDYDFVCRAGRAYAIHEVDDLWSVCSIRENLLPEPVSEADRLDALVAASRKHWGSWMTGLRWRCELSHGLYRMNLHEHARHHARRWENARAEGRAGRAAAEFLLMRAFSREMAQGRRRPGGF